MQAKINEKVSNKIYLNELAGSEITKINPKMGKTKRKLKYI